MPRQHLAGGGARGAEAAVPLRKRHRVARAWRPDEIETGRREEEERRRAYYNTVQRKKAGIIQHFVRWVKGLFKRR